MIRKDGRIEALRADVVSCQLSKDNAQCVAHVRQNLICVK